MKSRGIDIIVDLIEDAYVNMGLGPGSCPRSRGPRVARLQCKGRVFLEVHQEECVTALAEGDAKLGFLVAQLHNRASDERHLFDAWRVLAAWEKEHPGTTVFALAAGLDLKEIRHAIKLIQRAMRTRTFRPAEVDTEFWIAMAPVADQLIHFATFQILEPLIVPSLDPLTLSPVASRIRHLERTSSLARKKKRFVWVTASVSNPLAHVLRGRLLELFWREFPNRKLFFLLADLLTIPTENGIKSGSRLAELLMDFYLDRAVLREWRRAHPQVPLLRRAGRILILCKTRKGAKKLYTDLKKLLRISGMRINEPQRTAISDLSAGEKATWLGYQISRQDDHWDIDLAESN